MSSDQAMPTQSKPRAGGWLTGIKITGFMFVFLCLVGLGVGLGVENFFGMPFATVYKNPFDLLQLSLWAIHHAVLKVRTDFSEVFASITPDMLPPWWKVLLLVMFCGVLLELAMRSRGARKRLEARLDKTAHLPKFVKSIVVWALDSIQWFVSIRRIGSEKVGVATLRWALYALVVYPLVATFFVLVYVSTHVFWAVTLFFIASVPVVSMKAAEQEIYRKVVVPSACFSILTEAGYHDAHKLAEKKIAEKKENTSQAKEQPAAASTKAECVVVRHNGNLEAAGRVVFSSSSAMVIYNSDFRSVKRVELSGNTVEMVSSLTEANVELKEQSELATLDRQSRLKLLKNSSVPVGNK